MHYRFFPDLVEVRTEPPAKQSITVIAGHTKSRTLICTLRIRELEIFPDAQLCI
jgi:hypothetical protein